MTFFNSSLEVFGDISAILLALAMHRPRIALGIMTAYGIGTGLALIATIVVLVISFS